ncbi:hypothetical protein [Campylobacter helveticus]|uniref:hypothetical protein n=1 Tax=Campylobacter helveticus TaxID=28898 RepID=UPI002149FAF9|nr:hypothetical protein [Campylobacter helveticus]MCR2064397.1 hypothetical protein [Campylobacter helveticus]
MQGNNMAQEFVLSEGVKALIVAYVKDKTEENLIKAFAEFGLQNNRFAKELKHIAIDEFRAEIDRLVTRDEFQASMQALEARLEAKIAQIRTEMAELKTELKQDIADVRAEMAEVKAELSKTRVEIKYAVFAIAALMFILQPTIFEWIKSILGFTK